MSSPPPQRHRRRLAPVVAAVVLVAALATLSAPGTAGADQISAKKAEAAFAEKQLNQLYAREDRAVEAYDRAHSKLAAVKHAIRVNTNQLELAKKNLAAARAQLAQLVVSAYKGGDPDAAMYVLAAQSFTDLVDRVDVLNRTSHDESATLHRVTMAEREVLTRQALLKKQQVQARKLVKQAAAAKREAQALISSQQAKISQLHSQINQLIGERNARLAREAAARRAAARAAAAAQTPAPTTTTTTTTTTAPASPTSGAPAPPANSL